MLRQLPHLFGFFFIGNKVAWIKSHQDLKDHPKLLQLCQMTGLNKAEAIGNLHIFWWWVLAYAEDGDLSKFNGGLAIDGLKLDTTSIIASPLAPPEYVGGDPVNLP